MCSPNRLLSLYENASGKKISLSSLEKLYTDDDKYAKFALENCAKYLGIGLANLINLFNPENLLINVGDFKDCPSIIKKSIEELFERAIPSLTKDLKVEAIYSSQKSVVLGMALNLCDNIFNIDFPRNVI